LVEEYVEAAPIEREFFLPEDVDASTTCTPDTVVSSPTFTAQYVMPNGADVESAADVEALFQSQLYGQLLTTTPENNYVGQGTSPQTIAADVSTAEWSGKPVDTLGTANMYDGNYVGPLGEPPRVGSTTPLVGTGVVADGDILDFNPDVHVIP
jgi:hypothetical protein